MGTFWDKYKWLFTVILAVATLALAAAYVVPLMIPSPLKTEVTVEAGDGVLSVDLFKKDPSVEAELLTDPASVSLRVPGVYMVDMLIGEENYRSRLIVVDTMAPIAQTVRQEISPSQTLKPLDFVTDVQDVSEVSAEFVTPPPFGKEGQHIVKVRLSDAHQNSRQYETTLRITYVREKVTIDIDSKSVSSALFLTDTSQNVAFVTNVAALIKKGPGEYPVKIDVNGKVYQSRLCIRDMTPPKAEAVNVEIWDDVVSLDPSQFVKNVTDHAAVTAVFVNAPVYSKVGVQTIAVKLTDTEGNSATYTAKLTVKADTEAPVFSALPPIEVYQGEAVSYKKGVTVTDNKDASVTFTVDNGQVDLQKPGKYEVYYKAVDAAGNEAVKTRQVTVLPSATVDKEAVRSMAQQVLDKIIKDDMSDHDKIKTIHTWVKKNMIYANSEERELYHAAHTAFTKHKGDCYNYFSITKVLLDACGIENMKIQRVGGTTNHYWLLVNIGSGWYHYDTTPHHVSYPFSCFMKTDKEVWDYAKSRGDGRSDYYTFDTTLYPPRATAKYKAS